MSHGLTFSSVVSSTDASRAWTLVSTHQSWFSSRRSWDVKWFSKQSAIMLAFSFGCYNVPKGPWTTGWCLWSIPFHKWFHISHRAQGVTSQFPTFISYRSTSFLQEIRLMVLATQLNAVLDPRSQFLATVSLTSTYVLADSPDQVDAIRVSVSYFTTGTLPPISSSWRQAPWDPRPVLFFLTEHLPL
jgi:hypothetical protein